MKTPLLTVPIREHSPAAVEKQLKAKLPAIQAYEIWLDYLFQKYLSVASVAELCSEWRNLTNKKLIYVCKSKREGGNFTDGCQAMADRLLAAAQHGADYIDIGLPTSDEQIRRVQAEKGKVSMIISWHSFTKTPSDKFLKKKIDQMKALRADILKIATKVNSVLDTERLIMLALSLKEEKQRHIIIGMGDQGIATRIFAKHLGNELNFVRLTTETAEGQLNLREMVKLQALLQ